MSWLTPVIVVPEWRTRQVVSARSSRALGRRSAQSGAGDSGT